MFVPRSVIVGFLMAAATFFGWSLRGPDSSSADAAPQPSAVPSGGVALIPTAQGAAQPAPIVHLTVEEGAPAASPTVLVAGPGGRAAEAGSVTVVASASASGGGSYPVPVYVSSTPQVIEVVERDGAVASDDGDVTNDSVYVNGDHVIIASDGSIVLVGDNGTLNGNTGDASSSGTVAIDVDGSTLTSGTSGGQRAATGSGATASQDAVADGSTSGAGQTSALTSGLAPLSGSSILQQPSAAGRAVSIAGYEDHSISVVGNDQIVLYDDSNVFLDRDGKINANTGDTDSSGLNVVDATDSVVRSGNSGDGEGTGDDEDEDEDEVEEPGGAALVSLPAARSAIAPTPSAGSPARRTIGGAWASVDDEDVSTSASGSDVLVIGGDGFDDLGVRSTGNRNIVVYDDSNLVVGGRGDVNAQIGDSDTGGAVVMGVRNSLIEAGCEGDLCPLYQRGRP